MKIRVMDYTHSPVCVGVYTSAGDLRKNITEYLKEKIRASGECELRAEEWDDRHSCWISFSPATNRVQILIDDIREQVIMHE